MHVHNIPVNMLDADQNEVHRPDDTLVALSTYQLAISLPCLPSTEDADVAESSLDG